MAHVLIVRTTDGKAVTFGPFTDAEEARKWAESNQVGNSWKSFTPHEVQRPVIYEYQDGQDGPQPRDKTMTDLTFVTTEEMLGEIANRMEACAFIGNKEVGNEQSKSVFFAAGPDPYILGLLDTARSSIRMRLVGLMLGGFGAAGEDPEDV